MEIVVRIGRQCRIFDGRFGLIFGNYHEQIIGSFAAFANYHLTSSKEKPPNDVD